MPSTVSANNLERLLSIMARLRDPATGCPWDVKQTFTTIAPYTIEEAYEVAEAISDGDMTALEDELGDLLLQVVFHSRMAEEAGHFSFHDVAAAVSDKMVRRHPHVFAAQPFMDLEEQTVDWESRKAVERQAKGQTSALDGVASGLPALMRAHKLQKRVGFDWPACEPVFDKVQEELEEILEVIDQGGQAERLEDEVGDLLFAAVNLARHLKVDPETALRHANHKFERRFKSMESDLARDGKALDNLDLESMEKGWQAVKKQEQQQE